MWRRGALPLEYDLTWGGNGAARLVVSAPQAREAHGSSWHSLQSVALWCEGEGCERASTDSGGTPLATLPVAGRRAPCPRRGPTSVALVVSGGGGGAISAGGAEVEQGLREQQAAAARRRLLDDDEEGEEEEE